MKGLVLVCNTASIMKGLVLVLKISKKEIHIREIFSIPVVLDLEKLSSYCKPRNRKLLSITEPDSAISYAYKKNKSPGETYLHK